MTLLVTQLKNQDPLNPLDNAQVTSQLAQLQTVTGVNKLNTTLETLKSSYQSTEAMQATNLIGHGVLVEGSNVTLSKSGKGIIGVDLATAADNVQVIVTDRDRQGRRHHRPGRRRRPAPCRWPGTACPTTASTTASRSRWPTATTPSGGRHPGGEPLTDAKALSFDSVASVTTNSADGVKLNLPVKGAVTLADIKQVL
jgi:flagellar basal-body rod modification protein FlgD